MTISTISSKDLFSRTEEGYFIPVDLEQIRKLKEEGLGATAIAKRMGIHRDSVYRLLK